MRYILILTILLAACLAASSPIDPSRRLVNRPAPDLESRVKRSEQYVKGKSGGSGTRTRPLPTVNLRKGEFLCGGKACKLQPGDKPPCEHCQYPVLL